MLYGWPFNDNREFSHRLGSRDQRIAPETCDCKGHSFVKGFGVDVDAMRESVGIGERDAAACGPHAGHYTAVFAFCSPNNTDGLASTKPSVCNLPPVRCYDENFLPAEGARVLFNVLLTKCAWQRHRTSFKSLVPLDAAYNGDPGTHYKYSRREYKPLAWIPELLSLNARVEDTTPEVAYANLGLPKAGYNAAQS